MIEVAFIGVLWGQTCNCSHFILMVRWPSLHFFFFNRGRTRGLKMITDHVKVLSVSDKGSTLGSKSCISYTICCHPCLMSHLVSGTLFLTHHHALGDA